MPRLMARCGASSAVPPHRLTAGLFLWRGHRTAQLRAADISGLSDQAGNRIAPMALKGDDVLEVIIERWTDAGGTTEFRWSLWRDGHRVAMGHEAHATAENCEAEATASCRQGLGRDPNRVTHL